MITSMQDQPDSDAPRISVSPDASASSDCQSCRSGESICRKACQISWAYMVQSLSRLYHEFDGDFLLPLILGEVYMHSTRNYQTGDDKHHHASLLATNPFSISEVTGIPRETVRRKIAKLVADGRLEYRPIAVLS
ncbi:hypothetical protein [Paludibacterium denitrificans]|uniref:HTH crp-type domain-containing protein n=1 Tax=Paludibacterium denitrificans TaxID=2675226 RepID=A0A844GFI0_9NEIS|nr:hypothetical protein [Paludibacterium denitrificans]MTD33657.1 hypothetical protein [Paludibacterium denitrificans]